MTQNASEINSNAVIRIDNEMYKVVESVIHSGAGRAGTMVHMKLCSVSTGAVAEKRFAPLEKIEVPSLERVKMQYLYNQGEIYTFMNQQTYDQVEVNGKTIGPFSSYLKENDEVEVEFCEGKPISLIHPGMVELKVTTTGAGLRAQSGSTYKGATLENGMQILVPQFIEEGDRIKVQVETGKYAARIKD